MKWLRALLLSIGLLGVASVAYPQAATWQVGNFMETTLSAGVTSGALTIGVAAIPTNLSAMTVSTSSAVYAVLEQGTRSAPTRQEIVRVTGVSGLNLTVVRGQDGTTAQAFNAGDRISFRLIRYIIHDLRNRANSLDGRATSLESRTASAESSVSTLTTQPYITVSNTADLSAERALTAGTGVTVTDGGANGSITVAADPPSIPFLSLVTGLRMNVATNRTSTADEIGLLAGGNGSAAAVGTIASTDVQTRTSRITRRSATSDNAQCGWMGTTTNSDIFSTDEGFWVVFIFGIAEWASPNPKFYVGIDSTAPTTTSPIAGTTQPSALVNTIGFASDSSDSGLIYFERNDGSGTASRTSTGYTVSTSELYMAEIALARGATSARWRFRALGAQTEANGTVSTDLPATGLNMRYVMQASNGASAGLAQVTIVMSGIYANTFSEAMGGSAL